MRKNVLQSATLLALCMTAAATQARPWQCVAPAAGQIRTLSAIAEQLEAKGYRDIRKLERKGNCYKVTAYTDVGKIKLYVKGSNGDFIRHEENN